MSSNTSNFGYEYTVNLCSAIEKLTENEEALDSQVFFHKGANLKFALERALYSTYASSKNLFEIYEKWKMGVLPPVIRIGNLTEKKLAMIMTGASEEKFDTNDKKNIKKMAYFFIQNIFRVIFIDKIVSAERRYYNYFSQKNNKAKTLFYVPNERFVWYTKPIFDSLPAPRSYITNNSKIENILKEKKIPFVPNSVYFYSLEKLSKKNTLLKQFNVMQKYDLLYDSIKRIRPNKVIIADGGGSECEVVNQICKRENIACVCIQQGWSPIIHNGFRNMNFSKMLVWGEKFSDLLRPYNPDQYFVATGSHIIDSPKNNPKTSVRSISFFFQTTTIVLNDAGWQEFLQLTHTVAEKFPQLTVIIREHPAYPIGAEEKKKFEKRNNVVFMNPGKCNLSEVLTRSDLSVSIYSSVILESIAAGVIPIIFNVTSYPRYFPDVEKAGAGLEVKNLDDAVDVIKILINNPKELEKFVTPMEEFRRQYFYADKEQAIKNIVNEIMN